jgi:hypothetical protein
VYSNGTVIEKSTKKVVTTGGLVGLEIYVNDLIMRSQYSDITVTLNGVTIVYRIDYNGKVTTSDGTVICVSGGEQCLNTYILQKQYSTMTYTINGVVTVYHIY